MQPCEKCAEIVLDSGTKRVVYYEQYRCDKGVEKLKKVGIEVVHYHE